MEQDKIIFLRELLGRTSRYVEFFSWAADRLSDDIDGTLNIVLTPNRNRGDERDPRRYNLPTADEVAMIIPGEVGQVG